MAAGFPDRCGSGIGSKPKAVSVATDLAEVVGGAIALCLLFDVPVLLGGLIAGLVSLGLLLVQNKRGQRPFERVIIGFLLVIAVGFIAGLFIAPPDAGEMATGLLPRFDGMDYVGPALHPQER